MKMMTLSLLTVASLSATSLVNTAKEAGLVAIPESQLELLKLIDNAKNPMTAEKVELGKKLYFDPRLSKSALISCNTCHNLAEGGDDGISAAIGHNWTMNPHHLNSPTVYNAVFFNAQFWDGRDPDLEKQAQGPIQAHPEMAATKEHVEKTVNSMPEYVRAFKKAYNKDVKVDFETITETIAIFERTLVTPSKFDDFLNGCPSAMNTAEKEGLKTFIDKGCATCHNGVALGGTMQPFEITAKYKHNKLGDFKGDKNGLVKVPTLRNITQTAPYYHNGGIWSLKEAIVEMGKTQLGVALTDKEATSIETFLKALDGRKAEVIYPQLPASTATTPKPNAK
jgi:cytochrome c peroxidase